MRHIVLRWAKHFGIYYIMSCIDSIYGADLQGLYKYTWVAINLMTMKSKRL